MEKICRTCKHKEECNIDKGKRQKAWDGAWDEWTCGMYDEAEEDQIRWDI